MSNNATILKEIKQAVASVDADAEVILFGSRARGDYHEESDWDVLVLIDREQSDWKFKHLIISALYQVELKYLEVITPVIRNRKFWKELEIVLFYKEVEKDGFRI